MSLFGFTTESHTNEVNIWMAEIRQNLVKTSDNKTSHYGYDFVREAPLEKPIQRFMWEDFAETTKNSSLNHSQPRISHTRSSISTLASLDTEPSEDIPEIGDLSLRISFETEEIKDFKKESLHSL